MKAPRNRLTRGALDELLEGTSARTDALADVLSATRAPGMPHEVSGLDAALAAFATASPSAAALDVTPERRTPVLKRLITAKVLGAAFGVLALGGVAVAASTGNLPSPLPHSSHAASTAASHVPTALPSGSSSGTHGVSEGTESEAAPSSGSNEPSGSGQPTTMPAQALPGLCQAWLARPHTSGSADDARPFTILIQAAGGKDNVNAYCTALLASSHPTHPTHPTQPTGSTHGRPSSVPPTEHPQGRQTTPTPPHRPTSLPSAGPSAPGGH